MASISEHGQDAFPTRTLKDDRRGDAMVYVMLAVFVLVVAALALASSRTGSASRGCCAPADPAEDLRMRNALTDQDRP
jgi:hypothetical protein